MVDVIVICRVEFNTYGYSCLCLHPISSMRQQYRGESCLTPSENR